MATTEKAATTGTSTRGFDASVFDETVTRIRDFNQALVEAGKESGQVSLNAYEKAVHNVLEFEEKVAGRSQLYWVSALANTHAKLVQDVSSAFLNATRDALK